MADEEDGDALLLLQSCQKFDDLFLYGDVERTRRLIADEDFRLKRQCACDADALPLPAAHIAGITLGKFCGKFDEVQQLLRLFRCTRLQKSEVAQRFGKDVLDLHLGIERRTGILKDHLDIAAILPRFFSRKRCDFLILKENLALRRLMKLHERLDQRTLAAAALAHDAESFPLAQGETHIIAGRERTAVSCGETLRDMLDAQDFFVFNWHTTYPRSAARNAGVPSCSSPAGFR